VLLNKEAVKTLSHSPIEILLMRYYLSKNSHSVGPVSTWNTVVTHQLNGEAIKSVF